MFELKHLHVQIEGTPILQDLSLTVSPGQIHAIMGPNGAGKSSLASAIMGHPRYKVQGEALLNGRNLLDMSVDERAKAGVFLAFQNPEEVEGVSIAKMMQKAILGSNDKPDMKRMLSLHRELEASAETLGLGKEFVKRDVNKGFSGGEKKRNEILQMTALKPKLIILDEIDSGLDVDGLKHVAAAINALRSPERSFLMITHYTRILEYIQPDFVHVLVKGQLARSGSYELAREIDKKGYGQLLQHQG